MVKRPLLHLLINKQQQHAFHSIITSSATRRNSHQSFHIVATHLDDANHTVKNILDIARWAPSGDNMQTWKFEIKSEKEFIVHANDTRDHCVYDLDGHGSHMGLGALLECIDIASKEFSMRAHFHAASQEDEMKIRVSLSPMFNSSEEKDPLFQYLKERCVHRRMFKTTPLTGHEKQKLEESVAKLGFKVLWFESFSERLEMAKLMFMNGQLRLTCEEGFPTHSSIIEWNSQFSSDKIPDMAVGLDPISTKLMKWALQSWSRVNFLNKYLGGSLLPGFQLDFLPGIACGAHFVFISQRPHSPVSTQDYIQVGRALQRFWLTATQLDLRLQPETTPIIFSNYVRHRIKFSKSEESLRKAKNIERMLRDIVNGHPEAKHLSLDGTPLHEQIAFAGRVGHAEKPKARSLRKSLDELLIKK
ncbi:hypothetical protein FDP41_009987 [Naegleria fowleri]|uniref:Nitroreductase domain-containing protein n=1 Tax=Naegleria fowleri TaxID=5763 RepID=A0A6A5BCC9_NAEFO|nr:uncharacterized protein FDP41_009987 [Naegleria fowleri]KAF0971764.1 hypothetical protein FDP41_009987 [Naegleria fowleri]